jgi:hypothetical protein
MVNESFHLSRSQDVELRPRGPEGQTGVLSSTELSPSLRCVTHPPSHTSLTSSGISLTKGALLPPPREREQTVGGDEDPLQTRPLLRGEVLALSF